MKYAVIAFVILACAGYFYIRHVDRKAMLEASYRIESEIRHQAQQDRIMRESQKNLESQLEEIRRTEAERVRRNEEIDRNLHEATQRRQLQQIENAIRYRN